MQGGLLCFVKGERLSRRCGIRQLGAFRRQQAQTGSAYGNGAYAQGRHCSEIGILPHGGPSGVIPGLKVFRKAAFHSAAVQCGAHIFHISPARLVLVPCGEKTLFILLVQHGASLLRYQRSIAPRAHGKTGEVLGKLRQIADCGSFIDKPGARSLGAAAREDERQDKNDGKGVA